MIELRFFRRRYNTDHSYYAGDNDVYCRFYFESAYELKKKWKRLMDHFEGATYSAWYEAHGEGYRYVQTMLCGGAFDLSDLESIVAKYEEAVKNA